MVTLPQRWGAEFNARLVKADVADAQKASRKKNSAEEINNADMVLAVGVGQSDGALF